MTADMTHHSVTLGDSVPPAEGSRKFRRIVTGVNRTGRSTVISDNVATSVQTVAETPSFVVTNLWQHFEVPVRNDGPVNDGVSGAVALAPSSNGSIFRIVEFPPDRVWQERSDGPTDHVHATPSLDYALVLEGEIWALLDDCETKMMPGDVLIQRGTRHAWSNRTNKQAVVAFVLIGGNLLASS